MTGEKVSRRGFLASGVAGVVGLGVGFAGGYFLRPAEQVTRTVEREVTRTAEVTRTVGAATVTQTITQPPVTVTQTQTVVAKPSFTYDPDLVNAAKKEGKLVIYSSMPTPQLQKFKEEFEKKFPGITAEIWRADATVVLDRIRTEYQGGVYAFDTVFATDTAVKPAADLGFIKTPSIPLPEGFLSELVFYYGISVRLLANVVFYNKELVKKEDIPKSYEALTDPKWRGKIWMLDPRTHLSGAIYHRYLMVDWGEEKYLDWLRRLKRNEVVWHNVAQRIGTAVGTGEALVGQAYHSNALAEVLEKRPVDISWFSPVYVHPTPIALASRPPHPNAALLFTHFVIREGPAILQGLGELPALINPDIPLHEIMQGYKNVSVKSIPLITEEQIKEFRQKITPILE
jgi:iron(III) transport system substrate-binding protein